MILQSAKRVGEFAKIDSDAGEIEFFVEDGKGLEKLRAEMSGLFCTVDGFFVALYRDEGRLKLRIGDRVHLLDDKTSSQVAERKGILGSLLSPEVVRLTRRPRHRNFTLVRDGQIVQTFDYVFVPPPKIAFDPTFTIEEDDFMLFTHEVLSDFQRRRTIWT